MSKTDENFRASIPGSELVIVPLNEHHGLLSFNCSNSELNDFLKNDALDDQNNFAASSRVPACSLAELYAVLLLTGW